MNMLLLGAPIGVVVLGAGYVRRRLRRSRSKARFIAIAGGEGDGTPGDSDQLILKYWRGASFPPPSGSTELVVLSDGASRTVQRRGDHVTVCFGWIHPGRIIRRLAGCEPIASQDLGAHVRDGTRWSLTTRQFSVSGVLGMTEPKACAQLRALAESHVFWMTLPW
jgi:hypothetical protein